MSEEKGMRSSRSATISTANPLDHKDTAISQGTRERFQQLDLDFLLQEYKEMAANDVEDEEDKAKRPSEDKNVTISEARWLQEAGLGSLAKKFEKGSMITESDIVSETQGLSSKQKRAVKVKAQFLNETLSRRGKKIKGDARGLFPEGEESMGEDDKDDDEIKGLMEMDNIPVLFSDLSDIDLQQVYHLNLLELTALMEHMENFRPIEQSSSKKKKKSKKKDPVLFGLSLEALVERDRRLHPAQMESSDIPLFVTRIISYLETHGLDEEGIFRKAGSTARIKQLRAECEDCLGDAGFEGMDMRPHDVAAVFKQFLREMPEPLLTSSFIEPFSLIQHLHDQVFGLQLLITLLPRVHRAVLKKLLDFLGNVAAKADVNKMGVSNLAVVFAPTLFYVRGGKGKQMLKEVEMQVTTASTLKLMIENRERIWEIPAETLAQLRFVNTSRNSGRKADKPKHLKRLLSERKLGVAVKKFPSPKDVMVKWVTDSRANPPVVATISVIGTTGNVIPDLEITETTTCGDILKHLELPSQYHLFELGGNIHRRRINGRCRIAPIVRVNPTVTFMIMSTT
eukprot:m.7056 g.7056  ORF g.7056 m.7056 type:complete len:568 (-) comp2695_c0_seq1:54-1757(-)